LNLMMKYGSKRYQSAWIRGEHEHMSTAIRKSIFSPVFILLAMATMMQLSACATAPSTEAAAGEEMARVAQAQGPDSDVIELYGGDGMKLPLDGSSLEAFEASLAKVERNTSPNTYETLENAIDYLVVYDLGAKRSRETLAARLDGMNGYDVIKKVGWRTPETIQN